MHATIPVLLALLSQVTSPPPADPQAKVKAQALLKEGTALFDRGDLAGALAKFQTAYGVYPSPKLQFNIGQADRDLGRPVEALEAFDRFLAQAPDAAPEILAEARQSVAELKSKLGQLKIECPTSGASVELDGRPLGITPMPAPIWTMPGRHRITLRHPQYTTTTATVDVVAGQTQAITQKLGLALVTPSPAPPPIPVVETATIPQLVAAPAGANPQGLAARQKWYFWAAAGATVALTTGAILSGLSSDSRYSALESSCAKTSIGCSEAQIDGVKSRTTLANVLWVLAGASAIATGVSFYVDSHETGVSVAWRF